MKKDGKNMIIKLLIATVIIVGGYFVIQQVVRYVKLYMGAQVTKGAVDGVSQTINK